MVGPIGGKQRKENVFTTQNTRNRARFLSHLSYVVTAAETMKLKSCQIYIRFLIKKCHLLKFTIFYVIYLTGLTNFNFSVTVLPIFHLSLIRPMIGMFLFKICIFIGDCKLHILYDVLSIRHLHITTSVVRNPAQARDTTLSDKFRQLFATGRWFSPGTPVSPTNKSDHHDKIEILL